MFNIYIYTQFFYSKTLLMTKEESLMTKRSERHEASSLKDCE